MKLSQPTFVYFNYLLKEGVTRTAEAGYQGVEIWGGVDPMLIEMI